MAPSDWTTLQQNYELDTYYTATFTWNGISEDVGIRSHGGASRSPVKPNLDVNFAKYSKAQTLLGLPFIVLKANNEDASYMHEWFSMKLFRKMGIAAPREAPAQVFVNGQLLGFYFIVEHEDETFLQRVFGESGGYLYEFQTSGAYNFNNLGTDPSLYAPLLKLKTNQAAPDLENFVNLVQVINKPSSSTFSDDQFIAALSAYLDPRLFLTHIAIENVLAESDGIAGGVVAMNNFFLYQFQNSTLYQLIPWDKDLTFSTDDRNILSGISTGTNINLLAQRLMAIPKYKAVYLNALAEVESLVGASGGWGDNLVMKEYSVIHDAAVNDPNKQCFANGVLYSCGVQDFETAAQWMHFFFLQRYAFTKAQLQADGYVPGAPDVQILTNGISALGGMNGVSPNGVSTITGTNLGSVGQASYQLPRKIGNTLVLVDGVRAPLFSTAPTTVQFLIPNDVPLGSIDVVVSNASDMSNSQGVSVEPATPNILAVTHPDGTPVSQSPIRAGDTLLIYATGLGAVNMNVSIDTPEFGVPATTLAIPQVLVGGVPCAVAFSGLSPNFVGLYQLNVAVPFNWASSSSEVSLTYNNGVPSML
jgi:uncharacterized protein (TIGR03437 family)